MNDSYKAVKEDMLRTLEAHAEKQKKVRRILHVAGTIVYVISFAVLWTKYGFLLPLLITCMLWAYEVTKPEKP